MLPRRIRRLRVAIFALCAFLLTQWTLAAHACPLLVVQTPARAAVEATEHCDHDKQAPSDTVCVKHCNVDELASGAFSVAFAALPPSPHFVRVTVPPTVITISTRDEVADATAPPLNILYCVSLT